PYGIRTRAAAVRGRCPRPLDEWAVRRLSVAATGKGRRMLRRLFRRGRDEPRAARQRGDVHALDRSDDPRGGVQSDDYRLADPTELVDAEGPAMMGPGGSP